MIQIQEFKKKICQLILKQKMKITSKERLGIKVLFFLNQRIHYQTIFH